MAIPDSITAGMTVMYKACAFAAVRFRYPFSMKSGMKMEMPKNKIYAPYRFKMVFQLSVVGFVFVFIVPYTNCKISDSSFFSSSMDNDGIQSVISLSDIFTFLINFFAVSLSVVFSISFA